VTRLLRRFRALTLALCTVITVGGDGAAQQAGSGVPDSLVPEAARLRPGVPFDVEAATRAWLATVPPATREKSDAYYEGGYWIQLWSFLLAVGLAVLVLHSGWSRRLRDWAEARTRRTWLSTFLYYAAFTVLISVLSFPFTVYTGFIREHAYGLATQHFGGWLRDQLVALAVALLRAESLDEREILEVTGLGSSRARAAGA
jgi:STE24 endopeptidase